MKYILAIFITLLIIISFTIPVIAESPSDNIANIAIGTQVITDTNTVLIYQGKAKNNQHIYTAVISGLPQYLPDLKTKIDTTWTYNANNKLWKAGANLFTATIDQTNVLIKYDGKLLTLDSNFKLNGKAVNPISKYPVLLSKDPINANYVNNTMEWNYGIFKRHIRLIEGSIFQYLIFDKNPNGAVDIGIPIKDNGYSALRLNEAWDSKSKSLTVKDNHIIEASEFNRSDITYPVTIDPSSSFTTSTSDGMIYAFDAVYNTVQSKATGDSVSSSSYNSFLGQYISGGFYPIYRYYLFFDTSSLNDLVTITGATLNLYGLADYSTTNFNIVIESGMPAYPHDPLVVGDFDKTFYTTGGGSLTTAGFLIGSYNTISLTALGLTWIDKTGITKFCLRSSEDIAASAPTTDEFINISSGESGAYQAPYLTVTFTSASPIITSSPASNEGLTTARLNSSLADDGGEACTIKFGYGTTTQTAANFLLYDTVVTLPSTYTSGTLPYADIVSLIAGTHYFYRVQATNSGSTVTSVTEQEFDTTANVADVTNFTGQPQATSIVLNWDSASGATDYLIKYSTTVFPTTIADGNYAYTSGTNHFITTKTYTHTGLTAGTNYYYSIWGHSGATYSTNKTTLMITTGASSTTSPGSLPTLVTPSGWFQSPNYTNMANIPVLYDVVNNIADGLAMPKATMWLMFGILISVALGILTYLFGGQHMVAGLAVLTLALAFWWRVEIVSMWYPAMVLVITIGTLTIRRQF
jgi:hypothetical protein